MGIFKRFSDLARSQVTAFLNQVEDKKKLRAQEILDLEENKKKAHKLLVSAKASATLSENEYVGLQKEKEELAQDIEKAVALKDEEKVTHLELKKQSLELKLAELLRELEQEKQAVLTIRNGLIALDKKISDLKSSYALMSGKEAVEDQDAFSTFDRMEEKIEQDEYEIKALKEILAEDTPPSSNQKSFDNYSDPDLLEKELSALKKKLKE